MTSQSPALSGKLGIFLALAGLALVSLGCACYDDVIECAAGGAPVLVTTGCFAVVAGTALVYAGSFHHVSAFQLSFFMKEEN